ncbi:MAG: hypothetical protein AB7W28_02295 [Armatimonadota bacterium]|mgnify:CR=1 FL=1
MAAGGVSVDEPNKLPAHQAPPDWSWQILAVAVLVGAAFVGGSYLGLTGRSEVTLPTGAELSGGTGIQAAASAQNVLAAGQASPSDGYFVGASLSDKRPTSAPVALPSCVPRVYYHYSLPGWQPQGRLRLTWRLAGKELPKERVDWRPVPSASYPQGYFLLRAPDPAKGFQQGIYEVTLSASASLTDTGSFAVLDGLDAMLKQQPPPGGVLVSSPVVALRVDAKGRPVEPVAQVPDTVEKLFACFSYEGSVPGTVLEVVWFCEGIEVPRSHAVVQLPSVYGNAYSFIHRRGDRFPEGEWTVGVYIEGGSKAVRASRFTVRKTATRAQP